MKWITISIFIIYFSMTFMLSFCQETNDGLALEIKPPEEYPAARLNEIPFDENNEEYNSDILDIPFDENNGNPIENGEISDPVVDNDDNDDEKEVIEIKTLKPEDFKFNPYVTIFDDDDDDKFDSNNDKNPYKHEFLAKLLNPENIKYFLDRLKRNSDNIMPISTTSSDDNDESENAPIPDQDDSAGRFLST